jgi:hypothetical protein
MNRAVKRWSGKTVKRWSFVLRQQAWEMGTLMTLMHADVWD